MVTRTFPSKGWASLLAAMGGALIVSLMASVSVAAEPVAASASADSGRAIYQQRGADGRVTLTDRPAAGVATERRWRIDPAEDAASAAERREASRAQAEAVTERIQRSIDQQQARSNELQIEQLHAQREADALAAERLRERDREYESRPYVVLPGRPWARPPAMQPHPRPVIPHPPGNLKPVVPPVPEMRVRPRTTTPSSPEIAR
ncbi:MAG: hypothetical protein Q7T97_17220 [Burkholderiaceae bacterium]|nr:hypothetical protein [Burkholderiaceae bacterium]